MNRGIITVVSGFAGAGKGTLTRKLVEKYPDLYALSVSVTTRKPREGEREGVHYYYKTQEEYDRMVAQDAFLEHAEYVHHAYGTPRAFVEENIAAGRNVILEIELNGAMQVRKKCPDTLLLFVTTPDARILKERLTSRGTETPEEIRDRMARASEESEGMEQYDYLVINDDMDNIDACVEAMHQIIQNERFRVQRNMQKIKDIQNDLKKFAKGV